MSDHGFFGLDPLLHDVRHGLRRARRSPAFAVVVVALLALGIGATTALYRVVEAVYLTPLPYPEPERLAMVWETEYDASRNPVSGPNFLDWQLEARSFESMAAISPGPCGISGGEEPEQILGARVTGELFAVLRAQPMLGRTFAPEEEKPGGPAVAILSHSLWRRSFAADADILDRTVLLNGEPHKVIGVMPPGFDVTTPWTVGESMEVWIPLPLTASIDERDSHSYLVLARLADGVTARQAQSEMDSVTAAIAADFPATNEGHGANVQPLHRELTGWAGGPQVLLLFGAAAFVLLIVCANVGGLLLARTAARQTELAVRASLGASRQRLLRQLLVENLPLALAGGTAGVVVAGWGLAALRAAIPYALLHGPEITLDGGSLVFAAALSLLAATLLGVAPAIAAQGDAAGSLHQGARGFAASRGRVGGLLIATQVALTLALANGAALMLASYGRLAATDHGFDPQGVLTARLSLNGAPYESLGEVEAFLRDAVPRVKSLPGVEDAGVTTKLPFHGGTNGWTAIWGREHDFGNQRGPLVERSLVTPGYFRAMGMRRVAGRLLTEQDMSSSFPAAVVNQAMVRSAWPEADPIGQRIALDADRQWITVVGVVSDVRQWGTERPALPEYYLPLTPVSAYWAGWTPEVSRSFLVVRSAGEPRSLVQGLKREIRSVDPRQPVSGIRTMEEILRSGSQRRRFNTWLIAIFAGVGMVLVAAGIYALLSTFVTRRTSEIGVRMALGADVRGVLRLVMGQGLKLILLGAGAGVFAVFASTRLLSGLLYGVSPTEPWVLAGGTLGVALVALLGSLVPALRATRIDPVTALRADT